MFKATAQRFALVLALLLLTVPASRLHAQSISPTPGAVTGGNPQPPGEPGPPPPPPKPQGSVAMPIGVLTTLVALGLA